MGVDKESSRGGGGNVGGFFQLFDWTAKSRKKLFSSKSDFPERQKQGKKSDGSFPMTRLHLMDDDEAGAGSSIRDSDYSRASSVTDDDGCGARAPGVVARLMGLDSLPTSSFQEPNSTPFFDTQSLCDASLSRKQIDYHHNHQFVYSGDLLNKEDGSLRNFSEPKLPKPPKVLSWPVEKFQTEVLPPKSAKSIPITHHKLLSPIKSHSFVPNKTAAHIMEAAAKIIEPGPQVTTKRKMSIAGSSSVPLKFRDLKDKLEVAKNMPSAGNTSIALKVHDSKEKLGAAHKTPRLTEASRRPVESNAAKYLKGQSLNKSWNGSVDTTSFRDSPGAEQSAGDRNKEKSISLAIQAKVNVRRRGMHSNSSQSLVGGQVELTEATSSKPFKNQQNIHKGVQKRSIHNPSGVLKQNNQKQNCLMDREKSSPESCATNLPGKKVLPSSPGQHKTLAKAAVGPKTGSRKSSLRVRDNEKANSCNTRSNIPRKKRSIDGKLHLQKNKDNMLVENNQKAVESSPTFDAHFGWAEESKKKGMDVVSFTFTAPLTRSMPVSKTSGQGQQKYTSSCTDKQGKRLLLDQDCETLSAAEYNAIGGDVLSALLEQKLRDLTKTVEASCANSLRKISASSLQSIVQNPAPTINGISKAGLHDSKGQNFVFEHNLGGRFEPGILSPDPAAVRLEQIHEGVDYKEGPGSGSNDTTKQYDFRRPSPVSVLEPCFSTESCSSLESSDSNSMEASRQSSSILAQEDTGFSSNKFHFVDADMDLSDSASSTSTRAASKLTVMDQSRSTKWEIEYVRKIVFNLDLMFQDFALGQASEVINPHLFNTMERHKDGLQGDGGEISLERKLLFDCVGECLDLRCRRYVGGGFRTWVKGTTMVRRKEQLADDVYKEITALRGMGDCIVDELVDKDMSCQFGRWLDFEVDAFVLGAEVEGQIYDSLVGELIADIFRF